MSAKRAGIAACAALLLALTACASGGTVPADSGRPTTPASSAFPTVNPGALPTPSAPSGDPVDLPPARWDAIVADLQTRGVAGTPELVSSEAVTWTSGALGCPKPGQSYTQALVDGMRVVVSVDGTSYDYRFGARDDTPLLCESGFGR